MGNGVKTAPLNSSPSKVVKSDDTCQSKTKIFSKITVERNQAIIHHYLPPTFPIDIVVQDGMITRCRQSWNGIKEASTEKIRKISKLTGKTGIVLFYDEFFYRLFDRANVFVDIFPNMRIRGQILVQATEFMLSRKGDDSPQEKKKIFLLGQRHREEHGVRPWHFSTYIQCFLETVMFWIGEDTNSSLGEAWTNVSAYTVTYMLHSFLPKLVDPREFYQNCDVKNRSRCIDTMESNPFLGAKSSNPSRISLQQKSCRSAAPKNYGSRCLVSFSPDLDSGLTREFDESTSHLVTPGDGIVTAATVSTEDRVPANKYKNKEFTRTENSVGVDEARNCDCILNPNLAHNKQRDGVHEGSLETTFQSILV